MDGAVRNGGMLLKIAALLVSLSLVAERAAGRSLPVRYIVLALLRRAESVATSFVAATAEAAGATSDDLPWLDDSAEGGATPLDAAWLALRFRLLAAVLDLCRAAGRPGDTADDRDGWAAHGAADRAPRTRVATLLPLLLVVRLPAARHGRPHDTS